MPIERHFLDWDEPVVNKVRDFLIPAVSSGPVDLTEEMVVVPTRQSGRRLAEALAAECARIGTTLFSPRIVTPNYLLTYDTEATTIANPTEVMATWVNILMNIDTSQYPGLYPVRVPFQDHRWALDMAETLQNLRYDLSDGSYTISDIINNHEQLLGESERWRDLAALEAAFLRRIEELGLIDPINRLIMRASHPQLPASIEHIVLAAIPDPTPLMIKSLENLSHQIPVLVLIHAPVSLKNRFDEWGRPISFEWHHACIDIPDPIRNIRLAGSPPSQSEIALDLIISEQAHFGPEDIAIGIPDNSLIPSMKARLNDNGLPAYYPGGKFVLNHPLYQLIETFRNLVVDETYAALSSFLRNSDVLNFLNTEYGISSMTLLTQLDEFQNFYLPLTLDDMIRQLDAEPIPAKYADLHKAVAFCRLQLDDCHQPQLISALRNLLQTIYRSQSLTPDFPEHDDFIQTAKVIDTVLRELSSSCLDQLVTGNIHLFDLLLHRLQNEKYYPERKSEVIDLQGWMELPFEDAPFLIVSGMNEGIVPDTRISDSFLPDSLRKLLNLRNDEGGLAVDIYLMHTLIESRRNDGRICFVAGKTNGRGDPLKPSRLLFRCEDEELIQRAEQLFNEAPPPRTSYPATISFRLSVTPPEDTPLHRLTPVRLSVTDFRDYLNCPFRFYLKHMLDMEKLDDRKTELDAMDFGSIIHETLNTMARNDRFRGSIDEEELTGFLHTNLDDQIISRFGESPPLPVISQLTSARQRLAAAARKQVSMNKNGWHIIRSEMHVERRIGGATVSGIIDRIDHHPQTGTIMIIDYKTTDRSVSPQSVHLSSSISNAPDYSQVSLYGKQRRWIDLQLPLYRLLLPDEIASDAPVLIGYFNLPKAVSDTNIITWDDFGDDLLISALNCAEQIIDAIHQRIFWPPALKAGFDDFEYLFPAEIPDCIDVQSFKNYMSNY